MITGVKSELQCGKTFFFTALYFANPFQILWLMTKRSARELRMSNDAWKCMKVPGSSINGVRVSWRCTTQRWAQPSEPICPATLIPCVCTKCILLCLASLCVCLLNIVSGRNLVFDYTASSGNKFQIWTTLCALKQNFFLRFLLKLLPLNVNLFLFIFDTLAMRKPIPSIYPLHASYNFLHLYQFTPHPPPFQE